MDINISETQLDEVSDETFFFDTSEKILTLSRIFGRRNHFRKYWRTIIF